MKRLGWLATILIGGVVVTQALAALVPNPTTDARIDPQVRAFLADLNKDNSPSWELPQPKPQGIPTGLQDKTLVDMSGVTTAALTPMAGHRQMISTQPIRVHNVVVVHGAWADGSSWNGIIPLLEKRGFHVTAVHLPFTTLADDVAAVKRTLALRDGPVLLVGHPYGGAVITEAGNDPKVAGLVYVAAFAPDNGQSAGDLNNEYPPPPGDKEFRPDANGFLKLTDAAIAEDFAQDLPAAETKMLAATQGQVSRPNELGAKVTTAAWKEKPCFHVGPIRTG